LGGWGGGGEVTHKFSNFLKLSFPGGLRFRFLRGRLRSDRMFFGFRPYYSYLVIKIYIFSRNKLGRKKPAENIDSLKEIKDNNIGPPFYFK
jgi:hypothetical protein